MGCLCLSLGLVSLRPRSSSLPLRIDFLGSMRARKDGRRVGTVNIPGLTSFVRAPALSMRLPAILSRDPSPLGAGRTTGG